MRRLVVLAVVGAAVAAGAHLASASPTATLPGCAAVNPPAGKASCTFSIIKTSNLRSGVAATTTWVIKQGSTVKWKGGAGVTTISFPKGTYTLTVTGKGFAGAGKPQFGK